LVPQGHAYLRFISDLAAYDPATHDGSVPGVVVAVMAWLSIRREAIPPVTPQDVLAMLPRFQAAKVELDMARGGLTPWSDTVLRAIQIATALVVMT
jgi:hypothetical protein